MPNKSSTLQKSKNSKKKNNVKSKNNSKRKLSKKKSKKPVKQTGGEQTTRGELIDDRDWKTRFIDSIRIIDKDEVTDYVPIKKPPTPDCTIS